ncbi:thioredoxin-like protein [Pilobolus umbonatus]|nr:thioredoxin-like protein [Pilobolus umbonatus]
MANNIINIDDISDDEALFAELEKDDDNQLANMREKRIKEIQAEIERRSGRDDNNHGRYIEVTSEKEFMNITTSSKYVVGHFYHADFRRCKIMDTHLEKLAEKYYDTRFIKIEVRNAPFLVEKLLVKILPCIMAWVDGYAQTKMVGFDDLGNTDSFATAALELKLIHAGVIKKKEQVNINTKKSIFQTVDSDSELDD